MYDLNVPLLEAIKNLIFYCMLDFPTKKNGNNIETYNQSAVSAEGEGLKMANRNKHLLNENDQTK